MRTHYLIFVDVFPDMITTTQRDVIWTILKSLVVFSIGMKLSQLYTLRACCFMHISMYVQHESK